MKAIHFTLPYPPSVNALWRAVRGRSILSKPARVYRANVEAAVFEAGSPKLEGRLGVELHAHPPDNRKRDLDNIPKIILDSLEHACVFEDDSQIDELHVYREALWPGGQVRVRLWQLEDD